MRRNGAIFSLTVAVSPTGSVPKVSCVVSKKVSPHAVDRNRIKRRCRAAIAPLLQTIRAPIICVFFARREAVTASYEDIQRDVCMLAEQAFSRYNLRT